MNKPIAMPEITFGKKILVVDDEEHIVELLKYNLERNGFYINCAYSGEQALERVNSSPPDLIILDYMLPERDGLEVAGILKSDPRKADIPIIFLTARKESENIARALEIGVMDYMTKPFNMVELIARIKTQLKLKSALDQLKETEKELREANRAKDRFFSILAHDLRSPLHILEGFLSRLNTQFDRLDEEQRKSIIQRLMQNTNQINRLLENLLHWSRLKTGFHEHNPEKLNVKEMISRIASLYTLQLKARNIELLDYIDPEIHIFGDSEMIECVFRNLIQNAIKFTDDDGQIHINSISVTDFEEIFISDTGIGIDPQRLITLFDAEHHDSTIGQDGEKGSGLGLQLVKELVAKNGGTISVSSVPGKGSDFKVSLPKAHCRADSLKRAL